MVKQAEARKHVLFGGLNKWLANTSRWSLRVCHYCTVFLKRHQSSQQAWMHMCPILKYPFITSGTSPLLSLEFDQIISMSKEGFINNYMVYCSSHTEDGKLAVGPLNWIWNPWGFLTACWLNSYHVTALTLPTPCSGWESAAAVTLISLLMFPCRLHSYSQ